jgi:hypothetical protein
VVREEPVRADRVRGVASTKVGFVVTKGTSDPTQLTVVYGQLSTLITGQLGTKSIQVKLQRAHGGCLGTRRR